PVRRALAAHLRRLRRGGAPRRGLATARGALPITAAARARASLRGLLPRGGRTSRDGLRLNLTAPGSRSGRNALAQTVARPRRSCSPSSLAWGCARWRDWWATARGRTSRGPFATATGYRPHAFASAPGSIARAFQKPPSRRRQPPERADARPTPKRIA